MSRKNKPRHTPAMAKKVEALIRKRAERYDLGLPLWDDDEPGGVHNSDYVRDADIEVRSMTQSEQALFGVKMGVR